MPTTNTATNQYNPSAMNTYNAFQPQLQGSLMQMATNPLGSSYFQNQLAQNQQNSAQIGQRNISNSLQNLRTGGGILSNNGGFMNAQLQRNTLANSNMQAGGFNSALNSALQNRSSALMSMAAYQPLQTGQTQGTSGLGTWLPQVAGAAMNMLAPGVGSMLGGQGFSAGYKGGGNGGYSGAVSDSMLQNAQNPNPFMMPQTQSSPMPSVIPYQ